MCCLYAIAGQTPWQSPVFLAPRNWRLASKSPSRKPSSPRPRNGATRGGRFRHADCRTCASSTVAPKYHGRKEPNETEVGLCTKGECMGGITLVSLLFLCCFFSRLAETCENRIVMSWCVRCSFAFASHAADFERSIEARCCVFARHCS